MRQLMMSFPTYPWCSESGQSTTGASSRPWGCLWDLKLGRKGTFAMRMTIMRSPYLSKVARIKSVYHTGAYSSPWRHPKNPNFLQNITSSIIRRRFIRSGPCLAQWVPLLQAVTQLKLKISKTIPKNISIFALYCSQNWTPRQCLSPSPLQSDRLKLSLIF